MPPRTVQLVLHYDGAGFAGWQRQPEARTVQGALEAAMQRLCGTHVPVLGAGRTDAGVHARGQAAGVRVPEKWEAERLRRALNAILPDDLWVAAAHEMVPDFHARFDATARAYRYHVATVETGRSPFRRRWTWALGRELDAAVLDACAALLPGEHGFRGFAVRGTAPADDDHRCAVERAAWLPTEEGVVFEIRANRFLHHMVRFLVGTMVDAALGRRAVAGFAALIDAADNGGVAPPAPAHALYLEEVVYPRALYLAPA